MQDLSPVSMICATLVDPKFDCYILTPVTLKSRSNQRSMFQLFHSSDACTYDTTLVTAGQQLLW